MRVESSNPIENKGTYESPKTSFKTNTNDDDTARAFFEIFRQAERELTGRTSADLERWRELANTLVAELKEAASKTGGVSSVPAFLTAHLQRKFQKPENSRRESPKPTSPASQSEIKPSEPTELRKLTPEEVESFVAYASEQLHLGRPIAEIEAQLGASLLPEDWMAIHDAAMAMLQGKS